MTSPRGLKRQAWIGLVHVKPKSRKNKFFQDAEGAYATILAWAVNSQEYRAKVTKEAVRYSMKVVGMMDIEPLAQRMTNCKMHKDIARLAGKVVETHRVMFDELHAYTRKKDKQK